MTFNSKLDDILRSEEDASLAQRNTINFDMCHTFGIDTELIEVWRHGVVLEGHELADTFNVPDYPSVLAQPDVAAAELDRLTQEGKIHWYDPQRVPSDLNIAPTTLIMKRGQKQIGSRLDQSRTKSTPVCTSVPVRQHGRPRPALMEELPYRRAGHQRLLPALGSPLILQKTFRGTTPPVWSRRRLLVPSARPQVCTWHQRSFRSRSRESSCTPTSLTRMQIRRRPPDSQHRTTSTYE